MTRVEKYRRYRNEISNMKFENFTEKDKTAMEVQKIHKFESSNRLNYDQLMLVHESLDEGESNLKRKKGIVLTKYNIFYFSIFLFFVIILTVSLILVGIKLWG